MINWFQKFLYKSSNVAPIVSVLGITLLMQRVNKTVCVVLILLGIVSAANVLIFISLCREKLAVIPVDILDISPNDGIVIAYILTYLLPLTSFVLEESQWVWIVVACLAILVLLKINTLSFSPILILAGYHCYKITLNTGVSECLIISKQKKIRNKNQIKYILRVNEFLLIDCWRR